MMMNHQMLLLILMIGQVFSQVVKVGNVEWVVGKHVCPPAPAKGKTTNLHLASEISALESPSACISTCKSRHKTSALMNFLPKLQHGTNSICKCFIPSKGKNAMCPSLGKTWTPRYSHRVITDGSMAISGDSARQMNLLRHSTVINLIKAYFTKGDFVNNFEKDFTLDFWKGSNSVNPVGLSTYDYGTTKPKSFEKIYKRTGPKVSLKFRLNIWLNSGFKNEQLGGNLNTALEFYEKVLKIYEKLAKNEKSLVPDQIISTFEETFKYKRYHSVVRSAKPMKSRPAKFEVYIGDHINGEYTRLGSISIERLSEEVLIAGDVRGDGGVCDANQGLGYMAGALGVAALVPGVNAVVAGIMGIFGAFSFFVNIACDLKLTDDDFQQSPLDNNLKYCNSSKENEIEMDQDQIERCERLLWNPKKWFTENDPITIADQFYLSNCTSVDGRSITELTEISGVEEEKFLESQSICQQMLNEENTEIPFEDQLDDNNTIPIVGGIIGGISIVGLATAFMIQKRKKVVQQNEILSTVNPLFTTSNSV